jgi:gluconolactonase
MRGIMIFILPGCADMDRSMQISRREFITGTIQVLAGGLLAACGQAANPAAPTEVRTPEVVELAYTVLADGLDFPEGPAFAPNGDLWCTELNGGNLVHLSAGKLERIPTNGRPNGMAFDSLSRAWVCDSGVNAIRRYDPERANWETILDQVDGVALQAPNDLAFDPQGNMLFTCPNFADEERKGYVVCVTPARKARKIGENFFRPNGLEFVDGGKTLIVADTYQKTLFKGSWDAVNLSWQNPTAWVKIGGKEGPDGMTLGGDGQLYQAVYGDGVIRVVNSSGTVLREIKTMGSNPTNAAVDPSGKLGLVVTETEKGRLLSFPALRPGAVIYDDAKMWP